MKLDQLTVKKLLQDIEDSNLTRSEFVLPAAYGERGSAKRCAVQNKLAQIKKKTPVEYQELLISFGVPSGDGLRSELRALAQLE